jgi:hypothetical protein
MPLERDSQRISDFMNQRGGEFFALITSVTVHLVNAAAVVNIQLSEKAGASLAEEDEDRAVA